jgi:hypothetical protein
VKRRSMTPRTVSSSTFAEDVIDRQGILCSRLNGNGRAICRHSFSPARPLVTSIHQDRDYSGEPPRMLEVDCKSRLPALSPGGVPFVAKDATLDRSAGHYPSRSANATMPHCGAVMRMNGVRPDLKYANLDL